MILSRRERYVGFFTVAAVLALALDRYALTPYLARLETMYAEQQRLTSTLAGAQSLFSRSKALAPEWQGILSVMEFDAAATESMILNSLRDWAQQSGLSLSSVKPEQSVRRGELREVLFQANVTGDMAGISRFLHSIECSGFAAKISDAQLAARKEAADDLTLQVRVAALCMENTGGGESAPRADAPNATPQHAPSASALMVAYPFDRYRVLSERNIYLKNRAVAIRAKTEETPAMDPEQATRLTGTVLRGREYVAFVENAQTGATIQVRTGQALLDGRVERIALDYVEFVKSNETLKISVGCNFKGEAATVPPPAARTASTDAPPVAAPAGEETEAGTMNIVERMRARRLQELNDR